jgi:RNA polymerase sigma-70 factor (ECF subfamily)
MLIYLSMIDSEADRSEFERIYNQYEDTVFRKTLYILKNQQDTEDVMQEVWIKVAKNISIFQNMNDASTFSYIMRIAENQAMTFFRKKNKGEVPLTEEEMDGVVCDDELFTACDRVDIDEIAACFAELPAIYRDVMSLYFFHQQSVAQIAALFDQKISTINSRLNRGRKKLIKLLEGRDIRG